MIHDEFQDSESSKSGDEELIIKPPQSSSELDSVLHHKDEKKQRHSKEYKSNKRHHHHHHHHHYHHSHNHKSHHLKSSSATSSTRNRNMESKSFHYRDNKGKDQNRESEKSLTDQDIVDARSKRLIKDVTESDSGRNVKYDEITDVRDVRLVKDIRESKRYKNEEKNTHYFEEMKVEWRKKRLQWLQHQKDEDGTLLAEKEDLQGKICEKELNENYKNIDLEYSRSEKNIRDRLQIDGEIYYCLISPVSSEEESMNYEETEKSQELIDEEIEHVSNEEDSTKLSDVSSGDNDGESISEEESVETISSSENEKDVSQKESLTTEPDKETASKKEDRNSKPIEANAIPEEKDLFHEQPDVHTPKRPVYCPAIQGCRSIDGFHVLNRIEEGTYGVVYRARDKETKEIVALKRLKMEREKEGFPITSLREINTLLKAQHPNIVTVREIVVGSNMDRIYIVMDYVEHDIKSLMKTMPRPFLIGEVKTLLMQLLCAVAHLHDNWILHRDLKTSNLLLSHDGILKVGDFGLAREYGSPLKSYTSVVVTLWYRAPELLLGAKKYSTPIDMWSVGCIFAELLTKNALFPGKSESDQINRIFKDLGTPSEKIWPGYSELPLVKSINITQYPYNNLKSRFSSTFTDLGFDLLNRFLTYNPARRISAEKAKSHAFFNEKPKPVPPNMFPTWPAKSEQEYRTARSSPKPPLGGIHYSRQ